MAEPYRDAAKIARKPNYGEEARQRQANLLRLVVEAVVDYPTIKRILVWGSFVSDKSEPADLDYSVVVSAYHDDTLIATDHRRFFIARDARAFYGVDRGYLLIPDYPLEKYIELLDFLCHTRSKQSCGIVEISIRGEVAGGMS